MESVSIEIKTDNAAFAKDPVGNEGREVARILRELAGRFETQWPADVVLPYDLNGSTVGKVVVK